MLEFLRRRWFLVALLILIPLGFVIGFSVEADQLSKFSGRFAGKASRYGTGLILFLMSVTLDNRKLLAALRDPGPVIWAVLINFGLMPAAAIPLMRLQLIDDFSVGLMIAASVPCTMAAASVWTRKAGGNDAVSLLVTIVTNGACFLVTPFWLKLGIGDAVQLDMAEMVQRLFETALVPIALGQIIRLHAGARDVANRGKLGFGVVAQACILLLVFWASVQGGPRLASSSASATVLPAVGVVWATCIGLHLFGMLVVFAGARALGFSKADVAGASFAGSQKTLPIGIYIATDLLAGRGLPFAAFPILMFHVSQLILDTMFVDPLKAWIESDAPVESAN